MSGYTDSGYFGKLRTIYYIWVCWGLFCSMRDMDDYPTFEDEDIEKWVNKWEGK